MEVTIFVVRKKRKNPLSPVTKWNKATSQEK